MGDMQSVSPRRADGEPLPEWRSVIERPDLFQYLAGQHRRHGHGDSWYRRLVDGLEEWRPELRDVLETNRTVHLGEVGPIRFSFKEMGSIDSTHLFGLDELIIFALYWTRRGRSSRLVDLGANIGLHSTVAALMGMAVVAVEPDELHVHALQGHLSANGVSGRVRVIRAAATSDGSPATFVRVLGNTTGSHVAGMKPNPYGLLDHIVVPGVDVVNLLRPGDLVKMDIEGSEAAVLPPLLTSGIDDVDIICEVSSQENAEQLFEVLTDLGIPAYAQTTGWRRVEDIEDIPRSHRDGSLLVSLSDRPPW